MWNGGGRVMSSWGEEDGKSLGGLEKQEEHTFEKMGITNGDTCNTSASRRGDNYIN